MIKIDNFDTINRLLDYTSEDDFYFCQIIKRKKDNSDLPRSEKIIKQYCLDRYDLSKCKFNIIKNCEEHNARAYINLNKRSYKNVAYEMNIRLAKYLIDKQYKSCENLFYSIVGETSYGNKRWFVDIDVKDRDIINSYINIIEDIKTSDDVSIIEIPTLNGVHLITSPFNSKLFSQECVINKLDNVDIHKNNGTLLYYVLR